MIKKIKNIKSNLIQGKRLNVFVLFLSLSFLISLLSKLSNTYTQTLQFELQPTQIESNENLNIDEINYVSHDVALYEIPKKLEKPSIF